MMNTDLSHANFPSTIKIYCSDTDGENDGWSMVYEGSLHHRMEVIAPVQNRKCPFHQKHKNIDLYLEIIDGDVNCPCSLYFWKVPKKLASERCYSWCMKPDSSLKITFIKEKEG